MPYILNTDDQIKQMLEALGISSLEELYSALPAEIRLKAPLDLPSGSSELDVRQRLRGLAEKNEVLSAHNSFLGAGCYDHYIPAAVSFVLSRSQFLTAYTPYQPECSQGILQAIYEYQSYISLLTGMDVSCASLLDGASALGEAALMALRITGKKKVILCGAIHPEYRRTLTTYLSGQECRIEVVKPSPDGMVDLNRLSYVLDADTACCLLQSPNFFGLIEQAGGICSLCQAKGIVTVMATNPISLAVLKEPQAMGLDIVCGDGQPLGGSLNFGGPSFGFLATKESFLRQMPGRIVGKTKDAAGNPAYCLTLQAREQHIRRERATSNICSNQSLNALGAAVYLSLMGREGFKQAALQSFSNAHYLYDRLKEVRGIRLPFGPRFFNEFLWEAEETTSLLDKLRQKGIVAGYYLGRSLPEHNQAVLTCCTEKKTKADMDNLVNSLAEVLHG